MLTWIAIILGGTLIGWISAVIADARTLRDLFAFVAAGLIGAVLGGVLLAPWLGGGSVLGDGFSMPNLLIALLGAAIVPAAALARRRGAMRLPKRLARKGAQKAP